MSNEIERMFASLSTDADNTPVMEAATLRTKTNRRAAAQSGIAGVALIAVVAGTAFGGQWLLAGQGRPLPPPGSSTSATATAPAVPSSAAASSAAPSSAVPSSAATKPSSAPPARTIPKSIPLRAFLSKADLNDDRGVHPPSSADRAPLPSFCEAEFASASTIGVRRTLRAFYRGLTSAVTNVPDGVVRQTVAVYKADGAKDFMADVRAAVGDCATETDDADDLTSTYKLISPVDVGDDSIRVEERYTAESSPDSQELASFTQQISIVRVGDAVTILWTSSYENDSAIDKTVVALTRAAHKNLADWRD
jgi:hypothetical protein